MKRKILLLAGIALLGGCASPWVAYQEAVRCHLDDKGPACDAKYQTAIKQNTKMPGVHSSYGTHLLLQGKTDQANEEFKLEQQNYPIESAKSIALLLNPNLGATSAGANPPPAAPAIDTTATPAPVDSVKTASSPAAKPATTKSAPAKKGASRAK